MTSTRQEHKAWTAAGADTAAQDTYASIRHALADVERRHSVEIFLQGSYANATNVRADSDVDVVVMTRRTFHGASERLAPLQKLHFDGLPPATFTAADLRGEVAAALIDYYGAARVHPRNKCIKIDKRPGYVDADVVPCLQYRWYRSPTSSLDDFVEGIYLQPQSGSSIVNFPKEHIRNGQAKNAACDGRYKETVRQMKRLRNRAVDQGYLPNDVAPGYLLECMVFNAPAGEFVADDSDRLSRVVLWLKYTDKSAFYSCDKIHQLFRTDPGRFDVRTAQTIIDALWAAY